MEVLIHDEKHCTLRRFAWGVFDQTGLKGILVIVEEIRRFVEADSVGYLSIGSLRKAVADDQKHEYCYACYTGDYPAELVNIEELIAARQKRK